MIIGHHINKEEGQVIVSVSLLPRKIKKQVVRRDTVEQYLSNKVKVGKCLKDNCELIFLQKYNLYCDPYL